MEDISEDVERILLGVILRVTPPRLMTQRGLEQVIPSLKDATCLWRTVGIYARRAMRKTNERR